MAARAFRRTTTGDFFTPTQTGQGAYGVLTGARLATAAANATAQLTDANGNVLCDLAAIAGYADECDQEIQFEGKVVLATLVGAGASVLIYVK
jgi:hypothetical protein